MKPTILFLFNSSDYAPAPWISDGGFNCVSIDWDKTDHSGTHRAAQSTLGHTRIPLDLSLPFAYERVLDALDSAGLSSPSLVLSFAPCTSLAVSGSKHFKVKRELDPNFQWKAVAMARIAEQFGCPYAVENPVSVLATMWRKPDLYFNPCDFGYTCPPGPHPEFPDVIPERDLYRKKSCLWTGNGFVLPLKADVPEGLMTDERNPGWAKLGGKSARTKYIRSLTPRGFARAVYEANVFSVIYPNILETSYKL